MCGIAGIIGKTFLSTEEISIFLDKMKTSLQHRGPDDYGIYIGVNFGVLNLRLSIVDIKNGHQPMFTDDKSKGIVYNGEVYNYKLIQQDLTNQGYKFKTNTDTEAILKLFEHKNVESFKELVGMFGFCVWDEINRNFYLVRDSFGIKPLYIYEDSKKIIFSSELKAFLNLPDVDLSLSEYGIQDYFFFRYTLSPYTVFKNIRKVESGTYVKIQNNQCSSYPFYTPSYTPTLGISEMHNINRDLECILDQIVQSQLMGEVPVGILLSGGIDSSLIAHCIHSQKNKFKAFSIGFDITNEFSYSRLIAKKYNFDYFELCITIDDIINNFDDVIKFVDEPFSDAACFPLYILAKEIKKSVTVVLSGEGGDELFAGYPQYLKVIADKQNKKDLNLYENFLIYSSYFRDYSLFMKDKTLCPKIHRYKKYFDNENTLNGMLAFDMKTWVPDNLMMKADKILMAHSLEGRFPFLDTRITEYVSSFAEELKLYNNITPKWVLKHLAVSKIPQEIINRPKMGFSVPIINILNKMKNIVYDTIHNTNYLDLDSILDKEYILYTVDNYYSGNNNLALRVWAIFLFYYWFNINFSSKG